jgi:hypothetical protein
MSKAYKLCPCGSKSNFNDCCGPYFKILNIDKPDTLNQSILIDWLLTHTKVSPIKYLDKVNKYLYIISNYLDNIVDVYFSLHFTERLKTKEEPIYSLKVNIINSILGSLTCLSQGLFLQSGIIQRTIIEDSLIILDIFENEDQLSKFVINKYKTSI